MFCVRENNILFKMSEEDKDNINKEGDVKVDENQPGGENKPTEPENVESSG